MLAIQNPKKELQKCKPNLLPCKINHDGPVNATERYWKPEVGHGTKQHTRRVNRFITDFTADGSRTAYFRGRKLEGREIKVPEGYKGVFISINIKSQRSNYIPGAVLKTTTNTLPIQQQQTQDEDAEDEEPPIETRAVEQLASFDEVIVWGHESLPTSDDDYAKGLGEWVSFAEAVSYTSMENRDVFYSN
jgi:ribonuclease H2 subunit C